MIENINNLYNVRWIIHFNNKIEQSYKGYKKIVFQQNHFFDGDNNEKLYYHNNNE